MIVIFSVFIVSAFLFLGYLYRSELLRERELTRMSFEAARNMTISIVAPAEMLQPQPSKLAMPKPISAETLISDIKKLN